MTVCLVIPLPKTLYIHRIYMVLANPVYTYKHSGWDPLHAAEHIKYLGLARTIYIYDVYTIFLAGNSPYIRSYTVYIYGSGQPYKYYTVRHFQPAIKMCKSKVYTFTLSGAASIRNVPRQPNLTTKLNAICSTCRHVMHQQRHLQHMSACNASTTPCTARVGKYCINNYWMAHQQFINGTALASM
jgi:hypothetical protein